MVQLVTLIPFPGFYGSRFDAGIDGAEQDEADALAQGEESADEEDPSLVDHDDFVGLLSDACDYQAVHLAISSAYADEFDAFFREKTGVDLGLEFGSMDSPREYNTSTDRIFCRVPVASMKGLLEHLTRKRHKSLAKIVKKLFTSSDGFASSYDPRLSTWLAKPLETWDHNELFTLIVAALEINDAYGDDWDDEIFVGMFEGGQFHEAYARGLDWAAFDKELAALRVRKLKEGPPPKPLVRFRRSMPSPMAITRWARRDNDRSGASDMPAVFPSEMPTVVMRPRRSTSSDPSTSVVTRRGCGLAREAARIASASVADL